jgi:oligoribonuclease NrnB/cAMP/cGMP phosphodiesterase (DHH superfamily)
LAESINVYVASESSKKDIFQGVITLGSQNQEYKVASTFTTDRYDEAADNLIKFLQCNVALVVDIDKKIIFIKTANCTLNASKFAAKLFEGGGIENIAIGKLNSNFLQLSKSLHPLN